MEGIENGKTRRKHKQRTSNLRAKQIAIKILQDEYAGRGFKEEYVVWTVGLSIQSTLFEENFSFDVLSREERQQIVRDELESVDLA